MFADAMMSVTMQLNDIDADAIYEAFGVQKPSDKVITDVNLKTSYDYIDTTSINDSKPVRTRDVLCRSWTDQDGVALHHDLVDRLESMLGSRDAIGMSEQLQHVLDEWNNQTHLDDCMALIFIEGACNCQKDIFGNAVLQHLCTDCKTYQSVAEGGVCAFCRDNA